MAEAAKDPHIVVHGAGSIGCYVGAAWMLAGLPVTFIGRQSVKDDIAANGLTVTDSEKRRIEARPDEVDPRRGPGAADPAADRACSEHADPQGVQPRPR